MVSRRAVILSGIGAIASTMSQAKGNMTKRIKDQVISGVESVQSGSIRPEYIPGSTRLRKLGTEIGNFVPVELTFGEADIPSLFASARNYFEKVYAGSLADDRKKIFEKKYPGYEIIPYIVAPARITEDPKLLDSVEIIYMARRKNPKPTGVSDWLLEWVGPIESPLDIDIMGTTPKAKTYEEAAKMKSLGAGTNFRITDPTNNFTYDGSENEYIVLATRYPQFGQKEPNIQTPFSEGLASRPMLDRGKHYFEQLQTSVTKRLADAPWALGLRDIEWYKIIQGLILTENMNPAPAGSTEAEEITHYERELRKVYATLGANGETAFKRMSSAGAKGIVQFTQGAWDGRGEVWDKKNLKNGKRSGIRNNYLLPGFEKNPDFHEVIGDHTLSVLAACAHVMSQYQEYKESKISSLFHAISDSVKHVVLAAGYNSNNTNRVTDFSRAHNNAEGGQGGVLSRFYAILSNSGADETRGYMRKFIFALKSLGYSIPENSFFKLHGYNPRE